MIVHESGQQSLMGLSATSSPAYHGDLRGSVELSGVTQGRMDDMMLWVAV